MLSYTEENYLKSIYHLSENGDKEVTTNGISDALNTKPASVSDMLKKLAQKSMIDYVKYQGVTLTDEGRVKALKIIRKHRLWEVFLVNKLNFNWDEVHEVAEELEHIKSPVLIKRLDEFLGFPQYDPHGDPIPSEDGIINHKICVPLNKLEIGVSGVVVGLNETASSFLQFLDKIGVYIGAKIKVLDKSTFDNSFEIEIDVKTKIMISNEVAKNLNISE
jgi:DtxR family Mn-dependent transcriptional regulator